MQLNGIGAKIAEKIDEILATGKLSKLENSLKDERLTALTQLERVYGVGPVFAKKLYDEHGVRNLSDLLAHQELLNDKQVIGLKYVVDFETKVPREEIHDMEVVLRGLAAVVVR